MTDYLVLTHRKISDMFNADVAGIGERHRGFGVAVGVGCCKVAIVAKLTAKIKSSVERFYPRETLPDILATNGGSMFVFSVGGKSF